MEIQIVSKYSGESMGPDVWELDREGPLSTNSSSVGSVLPEKIGCETCAAFSKLWTRVIIALTVFGGLFRLRDRPIAVS